MKTLLIAALSLAISTLGHSVQMTDEMRDWLDHQNQLDEQREATARQEDALEDIQWRLIEQQRQNQANARARAAAQADAAQRQQEQLERLRVIEQQQRNLEWQAQQRRLRRK
jgi:hypothetical protein